MVQRLYNNTNEEVEEVIKMIGLEGRINKKVSNFSLGMKQRLAIGMCLLSNPKFLILDEPTNGLDPTGIIDLRNFIEKLSKEKGIAILLSSHILSEVEKISDRIIFIKEGKIVFNADSYEEEGLIYKLKVTDKDKAYNILKENKNITNIYNNDSIEIHMKENHIGSIFKELINNNIEIKDIDKEKKDLESMYYKIFKE